MKCIDSNTYFDDLLDVKQYIVSLFTWCLSSTYTCTVVISIYTFEFLPNFINSLHYSINKILIIYYITRQNMYRK